jgi:hypothetical protein
VKVIGLAETRILRAPALSSRGGELPRNRAMGSSQVVCTSDPSKGIAAVLVFRTGRTDSLTVCSLMEVI